MIYLPYLHSAFYKSNLEGVSYIKDFPVKLLTHYYVFELPFLTNKYLLYENSSFPYGQIAISEINQKIISSIEIEDKHNYSFKSISLIWLMSSKALFTESFSGFIKSAPNFNTYNQHVNYFKTKHLFIRYMVLVDNIKNQQRHFFSIIKTHKTTKLLKHYYLEKILDENEIYRILLSLINKKIRKQRDQYFPIWLTSSNSKEETIDMGITIESLLQYQPCEVKQRLETGSWFPKNYSFNHTVGSINVLPQKTTTSIDRYLSDLELE